MLSSSGLCFVGEKILSVKSLVKQKSLVTFDQQTYSTNFCNLQFLIYQKSNSEKKKKKCKRPKFYTNQIFMKYVTLGVLISGGIPKQ